MDQKNKLQITSARQDTSTIIVQSCLSNNLLSIIDPANYSSIHIVTDAATQGVAEKVAQQMNAAHIAIVEGPEDKKSFSGLEYVCEQLASQRADRHSLVINVGGGALCDLGGLAASIYMRGLQFVNIPTTLLADVDASTGGKTGINAFGIKNLIGAFSQPLFVLIDSSLLAGLPAREFHSGCAEMLKHGLIADESYFGELAQTNPDDLLNNDAYLSDLIYRSCMIKHDIVNADEQESGERKKLNFGHTVGHAIESLSHADGKPYLHGEAVALGMLVEAKLSNLQDSDYEKIRASLLNYDLPVALKHSYDMTALIEKMKADKKNTAGSIRFTLLSAIGTALYDQERSVEEIIEALKIIQP